MEENNLNEVTEEVKEEVVETPAEAPAETPVETPVEVPAAPEKKNNNKLLILVIALILVIGGVVGCLFLLGGDKDKQKVETPTEEKQSPYRLSGNGLEDFDLAFLKLENNGKNKVYSPISIKYMLAMLNEGTEGESNSQIKALIGDYKPNKYENSANMSLANAMFIKSDIKEAIKETYTQVLKDKYGAEIIYDDFSSPNTINSWIKDKTLNLLENALDKINPNDLLYIVNALGIDMEWTSKFEPEYSRGYTGYVWFGHTTFGWSVESFGPKAFENIPSEGENGISGMDVAASFMKYDVIKENGGEEAYRQKVKDWHINCWNQLQNSEMTKPSEAEIDRDVDDVVKSVKEVYGSNDISTDFSFYVDDNIKVFAKDLKEYNGLTLEYIGFMPVTGTLDEFIKNVSAKQLNEYIGKLKKAESASFEDGSNTLIRGYIPKFKYEYELDLKKDLQELGVKDVFSLDTAKLTKMTDDPIFIDKAIHKANIYFNQDGIKASATTMGGGAGNANGPCFYEEKLPVKEINITFDKPYIYIVRNKNTGEVWFTGSVYTPMLYSEDHQVLY